MKEDRSIDGLRIDIFISKQEWLRAALSFRFRQFFYWTKVKKLPCKGGM
ncbi:MAG TPA: hypothetical protein IAA11_04540 [Candidatus Blautia intestinigallinarum]|nr:hypothetical protein [Candidatus Blautia intestinigallinarum]